MYKAVFGDEETSKLFTFLHLLTIFTVGTDVPPKSKNKLNAEPRPLKPIKSEVIAIPKLEEDKEKPKSLK